MKNNFLMLALPLYSFWNLIFSVKSAFINRCQVPAIIPAFIVTIFSLQAQPANPTLPHLIEKNGRHALIVNGQPYLILGAQCNNSTAWPAMLPKIWTAMEALHVNTLEIPIYWEQFEPRQGEYDYHVIDTIITQARSQNLRLILLWFATWKIFFF